jgi:phosphoribosylanthranilate isomerase
VSIWIKICGNTSLADAQVAVDAGADAVGFVFAASPRRVTREQVAAIIPELPSSVEKIGVFVDSSVDEIASIIRHGGLTGVQLHSDAGREVTARLRRDFGAQLRILRVVHFGPAAAEQAGALAGDPNLDGILVDSRTATAVGGTGIAYDWGVASTTLFRNAEAQKRIAAGGLNADNVAAAIATLAPWGVDVVSGVESAPGCKDPAKVIAFVRNARAAATR